jgi:hypothetical protein
MKHQAIRNTHPSVVSIITTGDDHVEAWDADGNPVELDFTAVAAEQSILQSSFNSLQYQRDRVREYPDLRDFADAYYWAQKGDNTKMTAWITTVDRIKSKYPKQ